MAKRASTSIRRARGSLSQDEILDGAQHLIERHGLAELSMPALARHLKSGVTSIYWYYRSKDELLQALTDRVTSEIYQGLPPIGEKPWDEELFDYYAAFHDLIDRHVVYRELFAHRVRVLVEHADLRPTVLQRLEDGLGFLVAGGLTPEEAATAMNACADFTCGFVVLGHGHDHDRVAEADRSSVRIDASQLPILHALGVEQLTDLRVERFEEGLRLLIDGVRSRLAARLAAEAGTDGRPRRGGRKAGTRATA